MLTKEHFIPGAMVSAIVPDPDFGFSYIAEKLDQLYTDKHFSGGDKD